MGFDGGPSVSAIMLAGGSGSRIAAHHSSDTPKQYLEIGGKSVLSHSVDTFLQLPFVDEIIIVTAREWLDYCKTRAIESHAKIKFAEGGKTRQESSFNGVIAATCPYVMVHDGARPFVSGDDIERLYGRMITEGAAILAVPVTDTVKEVDEMAGSARIKRTLERNTLMAAVTPQAFRRDLLLKAHEAAQKAGFSGTDDASLLEHMGESVAVVEGSSGNIKITTKEDLDYAEFVVRSR